MQLDEIEQTLWRHKTICEKFDSKKYHDYSSFTHMFIITKHAREKPPACRNGIHEQV